jgi:sugar/nucleoside kinase (ribokinase family)
MSSSRSGITAGGTWIVDYSKVISEFPHEGACTSIVSETINNGGAPYNLLVDLCRMGCPFPLRAIGCIGHDMDGSSILKDCKAHDIDTSRIRMTPESSTSFSDVMTTRETGVRTSFNYPGANALLNVDDFQFRHDNSRIFFLGTLFFMSALDETIFRHGSKAALVLASARREGILTCVDIERTNLPASFVEAGGRAALAETDIVILNIEVAEILSGIKIRYPAGVDIFAAREAARVLQAFGQAECVVIRFPVGAIALSDKGEIVTEGSVKLPKTRLVSATGAGHAFTAGFLYGYHENWSLLECLKAAHASAAACLMDKTASGGIRKLSSCLTLLDKFGQREMMQPVA